jgi:hypothetical protein
MNSNSVAIAMQNQAKLRENIRSWPRFMVIMQGHYFFEHCTWYRECLIIDISRKGASVKLPIDENITVGAAIILQVFDKRLYNITIKGEIIWVKQLANAFIVGVKFPHMLDSKTFNNLG